MVGTVRQFVWWDSSESKRKGNRTHHPQQRCLEKKRNKRSNNNSSCTRKVQCDGWHGSAIRVVGLIRIQAQGQSDTPPTTTLFGKKKKQGEATTTLLAPERSSVVVGTVRQFVWWDSSESKRKGNRTHPGDTLPLHTWRRSLVVVRDERSRDTTHVPSSKKRSNEAEVPSDCYYWRGPIVRLLLLPG